MYVYYEMCKAGYYPEFSSTTAVLLILVNADNANISENCKFYSLLQFVHF